MNILLQNLLACSMLAAISCPSFAEDAVYTQKSNLPTLYIETENHAGIPSKKEDYVKATIHLVDGGKVTVYDALGIRGRGNSTWGLAKKPYRLKFDKKQEFLGPERAKAKSWTLLANHGDKTLMRNAVAAHIGSFAGQPFTAAVQFVDLVLNGEYLGNYQISDHIEVREKRVDITEQEEGLPATENISGGYLLEVDGFAYDEASYFITNRNVAITIKSPDEDVISIAQRRYIRDYINEFEAALFSDDFKDPEKGYRKYVDESTLASWYVSCELTGNVDCFWSTYIYKEKDDPKIYWGPLWDFDIAFNNCDRTGEVTKALMAERAFGDDLTKLWIKRMWQDPWFAALINNKWKEVVEAGIEDSVLKYIDDTAVLLEESQRLNFSKWRINEHVYNEIVLFSTYREGVDYLKKFISEHIGYLTTAFERAEAALTPPEPFEAETDYFYTITNKGVDFAVDIDSYNDICIWRPAEERLSQHWYFVPDGNGYYQIINRETELAISDAAVKSGNSYSPGSQLKATTPNFYDRRQLWTIAPASSLPGMGMVIANAETGLAWNNSGGLISNGNPILSWYNNSENPDKTTRQWNITRTSDKVDGLEAAPIFKTDYFITFDKSTGMLHFRTSGEKEVSGSAAILSPDGKTMMQFVLSENVDISALGNGCYILTWTADGVTRNLKFTK